MWWRGAVLLAAVWGSATAPAPSDSAARLQSADVIAKAWETPAWRSRVRTGLSPKMRRLARRLRGNGPPVDVEDPCLRRAGRSCVASALDPFFGALDGLARVEAHQPVVIAAFGNSLIASDRIVDRVRRRFAERFGNGGRGVLLIDRQAAYGPRSRTGMRSSGWEPRNLGELEPLPHPVGLSGVYHRAERKGARARFGLRGEHAGTLWWWDGPAKAPITVRIDGHEVARTEPHASGEGVATRFKIPPRARKLEVIAEKKGALSHGLVLEQRSFGVVVDSFGVPSADATLWLRADEDLFSAQLAARAPRLVMVMLGGNEAKRLQWHRTRRSRVEASLRAFIRRVTDVPSAPACLVVGPIDAVLGKDAEDPFEERPWLRRVNALERKVALSEGCAYFDFYEAMGGRGSLKHLRKLGWVHDDLVHPRGRGLDLLGELLADALLRAYAHAPLRGNEGAIAHAWQTLAGDPGGVDGTEQRTAARRIRLALEAEDDFARGLARGLAEADALATKKDRDALLLDDAGARGAVEELFEDEAARALLEARGWRDEEGGLTRRGGLGLAALLAAGAER